MSKGKAILAIIAIIVTIVCVVTIVLLFSPLRTLLKTDQRQNIIETSMRLDSLQSRANINDAYVNNVVNILTNNIDIVSDKSKTNEIAVIPIDSIASATFAENDFVRQYEDREKFNISVLSPIEADGMSFYPPISGAILFEPEDGNKTKAILITNNISPVSAIYRGSVIDCYYSPSTGMTAIIQHPNGFISHYSGMCELFVKKGDKVVAGTHVGLCEADKHPLTFELWHNGTILNPIEYISF